MWSVIHRRFSKDTRQSACDWSRYEMGDLLATLSDLTDEPTANKTLIGTTGHIDRTNTCNRIVHMRHLLLDLEIG
jgi:hypothetical protein